MTATDTARTIVERITDTDDLLRRNDLKDKWIALAVPVIDAILDLARKQGQAEMSDGLRLAFESSGVMPDWLCYIKARLEAAEKERDNLRGENADLLARLDAAAFGATQVNAEMEALKAERDELRAERESARVAGVGWGDIIRLSQRVRELEARLGLVVDIARRYSELHPCMPEIARMASEPKP